MLLIVLTLTSVGYGVIVPFHDDFDGPMLDPYWTSPGPSLPNPDPIFPWPLPGYLRLYSGESISHVDGVGDFTAELQIDNLNMAGATVSQWQFLDFEPDNPAALGGGLIFMGTDGVNDNLSLQLHKLNAGPQGAIANITLSTINSLDLRVTWVDDPAPGVTGTFTAWYNQNNTGWLSMGSFVNAVEAQLERTETIFVFAAAPNADGQLNAYMDLDSYDIVPEPATMMLLGLGALYIRKSVRR